MWLEAVKSWGAAPVCCSSEAPPGPKSRKGFKSSKGLFKRLAFLDDTGVGCLGTAALPADSFYCKAPKQPFNFAGEPAHELKLLNCTSTLAWHPKHAILAYSGNFLEGTHNRDFGNLGIFSAKR